MRNPTTATFDQAVAHHFAPLAVNAKLAIQHLCDGAYEVQGKEFIMRIRRGTGHRKDILVTLLQSAERPAENDDLSKEIGLGVVAQFYGEKLEEASLDTQEEYLRSAGSLAEAAGRLLFAYLIGDRTDFAQLKNFATARSGKAVSEIPDYRFPKNVRKEWI